MNISNTEEKLSKIDKDRLIHSPSQVSLRTLRVLNTESIKRGYNRNLYVEMIEEGLKEGMDKSSDVSWRGLETQVLLIPLMVHEHKGGEPCEQHIRCEVYTGGYLGSDPLLDVPMEMFTELETVPESILKEVV